MPPAAPHLLALPREVRDQIYSYLHKELRLYYAGPNESMWRFTVTIAGTPYLSILLACSQTHNEYKETTAFKLLSAWFHLRCPSSSDFSGQVLTLKDQKVLARIGCATVSFDNVFRLYNQAHIVVMSVRSCFDELPRLRTLRVLDQSTAGAFDDASLPTLPGDLAFYHLTTLASPSELVRGLKLAWNGTGRTVEHLGLSDVIPESHRVLEFSASVYVTTANDVVLWTPEEVLADSRLMAYPEEELSRLRQENPELLTVLPNKMLGWREKFYL